MAVVSATSDNSEIITANNDINDTIEIKNNNDNTILTETDGGTFSDLYNKINNSVTGEITLENDYTGSDAYNEGNGVVIEKDNIVIDGKGHTIDGSGTSRIFDIDCNGLVTLKNIRFINGNSDMGGAIFSVSTVNIVNCTFIGNNASTGGAVYFYNYISSIINSTFISNTADSAGAVFYNGWDKLYIINSTFINNSANYGGAYYSYDTSKVITREYIMNCMFINNTAKSGSAFAFLSSNTTIRNSIFLNNSKDLMFSNYGSSIDANCNWFGNTFENRTAKPINVFNTLLTKWLYLDIFTNINFTSTLSINNIYDSETGETSIWNTSGLPVINVGVKSDSLNLSANNVILDHSGKGEVSYDLVDDANLTVNFENVEYSKEITFGSFLKLQAMIRSCDDNSIIRLNRDFIYDGRDAAYPVPYLIFSNKNNITVEGNGHVIDAKGMSRIFVITQNCRDIVLKNLIIKNGVANNRGENDHGAGLISLSSHTRLLNCTFINNTANGLSGGGAVYFDTHSGEIIDCTFIGNSHTYSVGGAVYLRSSSTIMNSVFINNTANSIQGGGGAIYIVNEQNENPSNIEDCIFTGNSAKIGGAIYSNTWGNLLTQIYNCTFIRNVALEQENDVGGGAIHAHEVFIKESKFYENAALSGAALDITGNKTVVDECVFINNTLKFNDRDGYSIVTFNSHGRISHSIFLNNYIGYNRIIQNPWAGLELVDDWFGNTGNNYKSYPDVSTLTVMNSWLYLNTTELLYDFATGKLTTQLNFLSYDVNTCSSSLYDYALIHNMHNFKIDGEGITFNKSTVKIHEEFTGQAEYTGKIIVEYENINYTIPYKFKQNTSMLVNSTINVIIDDKVSPELIILPFEYDYMPFIKNSITYTINDTSIAKMDNGKIVGVKQGLALLTIKFNGRDALGRDRFLPCNATVLINVTRIPTSIQLVENVTSVLVGDQGNFRASIFNHKNKSVSGSVSGVSNNSDVLKISMLSYRATGEGVARITLSYAGSSKYMPSTCEFDVMVTKRPATIIVEPSSYFELNQSKNLFITVYLKEDSHAYLKFESNDTSVATFDNGVINAISPGIAKITVSYAGSNQRCANETYFIVNVTAVKTHIEVESSARVNVTDCYPLFAVLKDEYGNTIPYVLDCQSSDESIVTCDGSYVNGIKKGQAIVTVTYIGRDQYLPCSANVTFEVVEVETKITVNSNITAFVGDQFKLNATATDPLGQLIYSTSNSTVVTVDTYGRITARNVGKANITITYNSRTAKYLPANATVEVTVKHVPSEIKVNRTLGLIVGQYWDLNATLTPNQDGKLIYQSSDENIVTVYSNGTLHAVGIGSANITINYIGNYKYSSANATVIVTVCPNEIPTVIDVENAYIEVNLTESASIGATLNPNNAGELTYVIGNPEIITIKNGIITGLKAGETDVTVKFEGNGKYLPAIDVVVHVVVRTVQTGINVENENIDLKVEDNVNVNASLNPHEAGELTYISDNESVATVDANGNIIAVSEGTCHINITYTASGKYLSTNKTVTVTVSKIDTTISVVSDALTLNLTESGSIKAILTPASEYTLTYNSSNTSVVTVDDNGKVTAVGEGNAIITIRYGGDNKYNPSDATVNVSVKTVPTVIGVDSESVELYVDDSINVNATLNYPDAGKLNYTSTNESVATVDGSGNIIAVGEGSCDIIISIEANGKYLASSKIVKVTVSKIATEITVDKDELSLYVDDGVRINVTVNYQDSGELTYISGNESVLSVDDEGNVKAKGEGQTTVTVKCTGNNKYEPSEKTVTVNVSRIPTYIDVEKQITLPIGKYVTIKAVVEPNRSRNLTYECSGYDFIEIDENGFMGGYSSGNAIVAVRYAGDYKYAPSTETINVTIVARTTSISVKNNLSLAIGDYENLNAVISSELFTIEGTLVYTSNDTEVIDVDGNGKITALGRGHAQITIRYDGTMSDGHYVNLPCEAKVNVTVVGIHTRIEVNTHHVELVVGNNKTIKAELIPNAGKLKYSSSNESIAVVDENGIVTGVQKGTAIITVSYDGDDDHLAASETISVTVDPITTSIDCINYVSLVRGETYQLNPILLPSPGHLTYRLERQDGVIEVDENGLIEANMLGTVVVNIIFDGNSTHAMTTKQVTVHVTLNVTSINVNKTLQLNVGENKNLNATLNPNDAGRLIYASNNPQIAIVDSNGRVIARSEGTATITVRFNGNEQYEPSEENVTVTVTRNSEAVKFDDSNPDDTNDGTYSINLPEDADGTFTILVDGKEYASERLIQGKASIKVTGLEPGDHEITMIYSGDNKYARVSQTKNVHIYDFELKGSDSKAMYPNSVTYRVQLTRDTAIMPGKTVTFKINGKTYNVKTDNLGYAFLKISLPPKTYKITALYDDAQVTNKITFTHIIKAKNLKVKKSASKLKVKVTLKKLNGKYLKGKKVILKFKGKKYVAKTNKKGVAKFTIKKNVIKKLKAGKKYKYIVIYSKDKLTKSIKVKK